MMSARGLAGETIRTPGRELLATLFHVNAITPVLLIQTLVDSLKGCDPVIVASLSARVGSIENIGWEDGMAIEPA